MAQPAAEMRRAVYLRDCCMYVFVRMRFQVGFKNRSSRAMRAILPVRISLFSGEKARKSGKGIHFDENLNIFSILIEIKRSIHAPVGGAGSIGICNSCNKVWSGKKVGAGNGSGRNKV